MTNHKIAAAFAAALLFGLTELQRNHDPQESRRNRRLARTCALVLRIKQGHELPLLDWELQEMARLSRERYGPQWATRFRESWGARLLERFDVHVLLSSYAQAPSKFYVASLFAPPRAAEDEHAHAHHLEHRQHAQG